MFKINDGKTRPISKICSNSIITTPKLHNWHRYFLTFQTLFWSFRCWLWTNTCRLGGPKTSLSLLLFWNWLHLLVYLFYMSSELTVKFNTKDTRAMFPGVVLTFLTLTLNRHIKKIWIFRFIFKSTHSMWKKTGVT